MVELGFVVLAPESCMGLWVSGFGVESMGLALNVCFFLFVCVGLCAWLFGGFGFSGLGQLQYF